MADPAVRKEEYLDHAGRRRAAHLDDFTVNSLHVLLSALWQRDDPQQVTNETWQIGDTSSSVCIGNFGRRSASEPPNPPEGLFRAIEPAIRTARLTPRVHWFRFCCGQFKESALFEALYNNEPWPSTTDFYGVRLFLMMKPAASRG